MFCRPGLHTLMNACNSSVRKSFLRSSADGCCGVELFVRLTNSLLRLLGTDSIAAGSDRCGWSEGQGVSDWMAEIWGDGIDCIPTKRFGDGMSRGRILVSVRMPVARFSGSGMNFEKVWCLGVCGVRECRVNRGDGMTCTGGMDFCCTTGFRETDARGLRAREAERFAPTFTANRVEWTHEENFVFAGQDGYHFTGNFFDGLD